MFEYLHSNRAMMIRQGDVLLAPVRSIPDGAQPAPDQRRARILAYGEKTGHMHVLTNGDVYAHGGRRFLKLDEPAHLRHDEHAMVDVPPGLYEVVQQRQYVPPAPVQTPTFGQGSLPGLDFRTVED